LHAFGTTPATVVAIWDNGCKSFTISGPKAAQPAVVAKDDTRYKPCSPTAKHFTAQCSTTPTQAQVDAYVRVTMDLATNHPTITLAEAAPLIHAASKAAR
jgi:hypothetical protein